MKYIIYLLINERKNKTYVGYSKNLQNRISQHRSRQVNRTKNFGKFTYLVLEEVNSVADARKREKYWKSAAGRKRLKIIMGPSSSG